LLLGKIPLLRVLIPFILGIIGYHYVAIIQQMPYWLSVLFILIIGVNEFLLSKKYSYRVWQGVNIYLSFFVLGILVSQANTNSSNYLKPDEQSYLIKGEIEELPKIMDKSVKVVLSVEAVKRDNQWLNSNDKIILYLPKDSLSKTLLPGDYLCVNPNLNIPENPKNPHQFNYKNYLQYHLIAGQAFIQSSDWIKIKSKNKRYLSLYAYSQKIRQKLLNIISKTPLSKEERVIAQALILGYKNEMQDNVQQAYSAAGATHVLAVSGLHVGIIYLILQWLFGLFQSNNKIFSILKIIFTLLLIWVYAFITGLSVSVMRAAVMFSVVLLGQLFQRKSHILNSLAASAFLLLVINPNYLFQLGFQLSYLAVAGIVIFQPFIAELWQPQYKLLVWLRDLLSVSVAAQIVTVPLTLLYFHQFPVYFLLTNLFIIPAAFVILLIGLITVATYFIHPVIFQYSGELLHYVIRITNSVIFGIQKFPNSVIDKIYFTPLMALISYCGMLLIIIGFSVRKFFVALLGVLSIAVLLFLSALHDISAENQKQFIVYSVPHYSVYNFIDGRDNIVVADDKFYSKSKNVDFTLKNNWVYLGLKDEKVVPFKKLSVKYQLSNIFRISNVHVYVKDKFFYFYGEKIAVIDRFVTLPNKLKNKITLDYLILTKNTSVPIDKLLSVFKPKLIIFDSSNSKYKINQWVKELNKTNIPFYDVMNKGAFIDIIE